MNKRIQQIRSSAAKALQHADNAENLAYQALKHLGEAQRKEDQLPLMIRFFMPWTWF
jgi:hypothetical protein